MLSIPNQLEGAYQGQDVTLECQTEAYPASINYWTTEKGDMIISGKWILVLNCNLKFYFFWKFTVLTNVRIWKLHFLCHIYIGKKNAKIITFYKYGFHIGAIKIIFPQHEFTYFLCFFLHKFPDDWLTASAQWIYANFYFPQRIFLLI